MSHAETEGAEYRYLLWRTAMERHAVPPWSLAGEQRAGVEAQALRGSRLIDRALAAPESAQAPMPDAATLAARVEAFGADPATRRNALQGCGLDESRLRDVIEAELRAEWVIDRITAAVSVDDADVTAFYSQNAAQFQAPELREARHILITVNDEFAENRRDCAHARLAAIVAQWPATGFAELAMRASECPSAIEGGYLGRVRRGQLYPALEEVLFRLAPGEMSDIVESALGFHLLHCDAIIPPRAISFDEAAPAIRRRLHMQAQKKALRGLLEGR